MLLTEEGQAIRDISYQSLKNIKISDYNFKIHAPSLYEKHFIIGVNFTFKSKIDLKNIKNKKDSPSINLKNRKILGRSNIQPTKSGFDIDFMISFDIKSDGNNINLRERLGTDGGYTLVDLPGTRLWKSSYVKVVSSTQLLRHCKDFDPYIINILEKKDISKLLKKCKKDTVLNGSTCGPTVNSFLHWSTKQLFKEMSFLNSIEEKTLYICESILKILSGDNFKYKCIDGFKNIATNDIIKLLKRYDFLNKKEIERAVNKYILYDVLED